MEDSKIRIETDNKGNYKAVKYQYDGKQSMFDSGNLIKDWYQAIKLIVNGYNNDSFIIDQSVDNYLDNSEFSKYYIENYMNNDWTYNNKEEVKNENFFVIVNESVKEYKNWDKLKKYCEDYETN